MNWLHPSLLGWCILAATPFLLHWVLRDRMRRIIFGGTRFLGSREVVVASRKHWLELLLMLLRAGLIALLVIAFARPFLSSAVGVHPMSMVLVDCSRSMQAGGRATRAQDEAGKLLDQLPHHEQLFVAGLGSPGPLALDPSASIDDARRRLRAMTNSGGSANLLEGIAVAAARAGSQPCSIHLISALPVSGFPSTQRIMQLPANCRLVIHDVALPSDAPVESVRLSAQLEGSELTPGEGNLVAAARVINRGAARTVTVTLSSGHDTLDAHTIDLAQDGSATVSLRGSLHEIGDIPCTVSVDHVPTALPDDNVCRLVATVVRQIHVAVVDGHPDDDHAQDSAFFITAALSAGTSKRYAVNRLTSLPPLDDFQAVILACPAHIDDGDASRLGRFVDNGGGLLIILGPGLDPDLLNGALTKLSPARVRAWRDGAVSLSADSAGASLFSALVGDHGDNLALASFTGSAELEDTAGSNVLLRFSNQRPALVMEHHGQGVSMLFAAPCDRRVGDFPLRPLFLPLMREMVRALHVDGESSGTLQTAASLELGPDDRLNGPAGEVARDTGGHLRVSEPGFYHLTHAGISHLIAVNGDPEASNPVLLQAEDVQRMVTNQGLGVQATAHGLERIMAPDEIMQAEARLGLGRWCLIIISGLLMIELIVAQSISRR